MSQTSLTVVFTPHDAEDLADLADRFEAEAGETIQ